MKVLYPEILPFHTFFLETGGVHQVYVEQSGNPAGIPVIFLHGGPCSGTKPDHRRFFDPARYHIILMDQRGCGQSLPFGELEGNTTQDLLDDMERIRQRLRIDQWLLFGGSWGGTLALLYAQRHTQQVFGMILRGVFLARCSDMDWFLKGGVSRIYPAQWQALCEAVGESQGDDLLEGLCQAIFDGNRQQQQRACKAWMDWGAQVALGADYQPPLEAEPVSEKMIQQVAMELHYARNGYFIAENQILENCAALRSLPTVIIHGQNDLTCPLEAGWRLSQALPQASYKVLPNAGHVAKGDEMIDALVSACDDMARTLG